MPVYAFWFFFISSLQLRSAATGCVVTTSTLFIYSVSLSHIPSQWAEASGCQPGTSRPTRQSKATVNPQRLKKPCRTSRGPGWETEPRWQVRWKMEFSGRGEKEEGEILFLFSCFERRKEVKGQTMCFQLGEETGGKKWPSVVGFQFGHRNEWWDQMNLSFLLSFIS